MRIRLIYILLIVFASSTYSQLNSESNTGTASPCSNIGIDKADTLVRENNLNEEFIIIDVRTSGEFVSGHIKNAININYYSSDFTQQIDSLDKEKEYLVYCRSGSRSSGAVAYMCSTGFAKVYNMLGGIYRWINNGYSIVIGSSINNISNAEDNVIIYPNPALDYINISFGNNSYKTTEIQVYNIIGIQIMRKSFTGFVNLIEDIDISDLHRGIYFVKLNINNSVIVKKLLVN